LLTGIRRPPGTGGQRRRGCRDGHGPIRPAMLCRTSASAWCPCRRN
jgi:hypothetical protein